MSWFAPYLAACGLLVVAGIAKTRRPQDTARALLLAVPVASRPAALRIAGAAVRAGALAEAALGGAAAVWPSRPVALAVAASYGAFSLVVLSIRARGGPVASCGCFGRADTPATGLHVAVDVMLGTAAALVAFGRLPERTTGGVLVAHPVDGVVLLALGTAIAWLALLVMGPLGRVHAARRLLVHESGTAAAGDARATRRAIGA